MRNSLILLLALVLSACATSTPKQSAWCESGNFLLDTHFEGGNFHACQSSSASSFVVEIRPEDAPPINVSPWYAFRVSPKRSGTLTVELQFTDGFARYWPKISVDRKSWSRLPETAVSFSEEKSRMTLTLDVGDVPVTIAAQEILAGEYFSQWNRELAAHPDVTARVLGRSTEGRPVYIAKTDTKAEVVVLLGRAHPPEVTGTIAMREFVEAILADTELAQKFRQRFGLIILPVLNPDGSAKGYWRHNVNGKDLNRDWGIFSQTETQNVARLLEGLSRAGVKVQMMLDFHSTQRNLFYTQIPQESYQEMDFASTWLDAAAARLPAFEFTQEANPTSEQANSKNYFHERYKIAAITYELGDETDRDEIRRVTPVFAEEFMQTMLSMPAESP